MTPVKCPEPIIENRIVIDSFYLVECKPLSKLKSGEPGEILILNAKDSTSHYDCMLRHNELIKTLISQ